VRIRARWVIGADGGGSPMRHALGLPFEGVTDDATFCVADLRGVSGSPGTPRTCTPPWAGRA